MNFIIPCFILLTLNQQFQPDKEVMMNAKKIYAMTQYKDVTLVQVNDQHYRVYEKAKDIHEKIKKECK